LITALGLLIIIGPATWLGVGLVESLPGLIARMEKGGLTIPPPWESVKDWPFLGQQIYDYWKSASTNIADVLRPFLPQLKPVGEFLLGAASKAGAGTLVFLFSVVITGFLFTRGPTLLAATRALASRVDPSYGESFLDLAGATIRAVSRGVIGISLLQAIIGGVGVALAGVPFASVLTLAILVLGIVQIGPVIHHYSAYHMGLDGAFDRGGARLHGLHGGGVFGRGRDEAVFAGAWLEDADAGDFHRRHRRHTGAWHSRTVRRTDRAGVAWEVAKAWIYEREAGPASAAPPSP